MRDPALRAPYHIPVPSVGPWHGPGLFEEVDRFMNGNGSFPKSSGLGFRRVVDFDHRNRPILGTGVLLEIPMAYHCDL